ncbi:MAG: sigma-70 family RNA polymerase sigma factor [Terriglobales bacterium]
MSSAQAQENTAEAALMARLRSGDEDAMGALYDRFAPVVYAVAVRVLGDPGGAEDVLQEVFLQLWRNPQAFDSSRGNLGAWLAVIARHRAIDHLRRRRPEDDLSNVVLAVETDLADTTARHRAMEKVRAVLAALPAAQRSALEMAFFEGLTHTEIASQTGEPLGTVKTRIRAALLALRKAFAA